MQSLQNEMQRIYRAKAEKSAMPWELPPRKQSEEGTIFAQTFLTVTLDEGHEMRNLGVKYYSALRIFKQAKLKVILTGTPLVTAPKVSS
jgi:hypothetical protein